MTILQSKLDELGIKPHQVTIMEQEYEGLYCPNRFVLSKDWCEADQRKYLAIAYKDARGIIGGVIIKTGALKMHTVSQSFDGLTDDEERIYFFQSLMITSAMDMHLIGESRERHREPAEEEEDPGNGMARCFDCENRECKTGERKNAGFGGYKLYASKHWRWCANFQDESPF